MDGLAIQKATQTALAGGFRVRDVFDRGRGDPRARRRARARDDLLEPRAAVRRRPVRRRPRRRRGSRAHHARHHPDSARRLDRRLSERTGLDRVFLAAPVVDRARLRQAVAASRGFVYAVSTMGITGARADVDAAARGLVAPPARRGADRAPASASASRPPTRSPRSSTTPTARSSVPPWSQPSPRRVCRRGRAAGRGLAGGRTARLA